MKIRTSFVSNSSSASFIISWKNKFHNYETINEAFSSLFYNKDIAINNTKENIIEYLCKQTNLLNNGVLQTRFFTSMYNSVEDFGPEFQLFILYLFLNSSFEVIHKELESDEM
jgi:hypothetical protein